MKHGNKRIRVIVERVAEVFQYGCSELALGLLQRKPQRRVAGIA